MPALERIEDAARRDHLDNVARTFAWIRARFHQDRQLRGLQQSLAAEEHVLRQGLEATYLHDLAELHGGVSVLRAARTAELYHVFLASALGRDTAHSSRA
jgi:hypothetical protein